ncbi:MAG: N-acetylmuramoyl-L-alanine amidase, partial [Flammeovirgaceae bacterium]|nr:N-acetylmuramoyl-L-alanine amidase [Flammeovirgaceae bacterium]
MVPALTINLSSVGILVLFSFFFNSIVGTAQVRPPKISIVIDAGHGGKDPGKHSGTDYKLDEKEINLIIAKKVGEILQREVPFVHVHYTRTEDKTLELSERVAFANQKKCDYFISLHCDSNPVRAIYGTKSH